MAIGWTIHQDMTSSYIRYRQARSVDEQSSQNDTHGEHKLIASVIIRDDNPYLVVQILLKCVRYIHSTAL